MRRVVFNQKGGVGKSSIAVNLAAISAARGYRTLVVDLDPQCNASQYLLGDAAVFPGGGKELEPNIGGFFAQTLSFKLVEKSPESFVHRTPFERLDVIPSNPELREIEHLLESKHKIYKLRGALKALSQRYDAIYVDTPPAFNFYTLSALIAAGIPLASLEVRPPTLEDLFIKLTGHDLRLLPRAFDHARRGRHIINQNIILSLLIITALLPLALFGVLGLAAVVLVHEIAEVIVILNGLRAARTRK